MIRTIQIKKPDICNHLERTSIYKMKPKDLDIQQTIEDIPPLVPQPGTAASRIQSFIVKARSGGADSPSPKNIIDVTGIFDGDDEQRVTV
jgi:hypothetical protein